jgi:hypothetical protein
VQRALDAEISAAEVAIDDQRHDTAAALLGAIASDPWLTENPMLHAKMCFTRGRLELAAGRGETAVAAVAEGLVAMDRAGVDRALAPVQLWTSEEPRDRAP